VCPGLEIYAVETLAQVADFLAGRESLAPEPPTPVATAGFEAIEDLDFREVKGQEPVKRALLLAAAGGHNVLMVGPPGAGKPCWPSACPRFCRPSALKRPSRPPGFTASSANLPPGEALVPQRPFRPPHHTISDAGLIGGGTNPRPGEVSLAHHGVLFLDELPEFKRSTLEVLRQPLEEGRVTISRAATSLTYPARFMLVAAMNPCPCGFYGDVKRACTCTPNQINAYRTRISGPLLDRIDIQIQVPAVPFRDLSGPVDGDGSKDLRARVMAARERQARRFAQSARVFANAHMTPKLIREHCPLTDDTRRLLEAAMDRLGLSARAYARILKIARTIADLEGEDRLAPAHVAEAIQYRTMDRKLDV
jgi:magnesium chelatase family protein